MPAFIDISALYINFKARMSNKFASFRKMKSSNCSAKTLAVERDFNFYAVLLRYKLKTFSTYS